MSRWSRDIPGETRSAQSRNRSCASYVWSLVLVSVATGLGGVARWFVSPEDVVMLFVLVIVIVALWLGRGPSVLAAASSVIAYDFFFVPPLFTLLVADSRHLLSFATMFALGLLISGLTARVRAHELARRRVELKARTEETRSSLLSAVSHDLRTPLAAITGAGTALRAEIDRIDVQRRGELLDTICEEAERLERLLRNLLDMTRVDAGTLELKRDWVPLEEILGSALERLDERLARRDVSTRLPDDLPLLSVDASLLELLFVNLLENALKYTAESGAIEIGACESAGAVEVSVRDFGPGIPQGLEQRIFEKFFRASKSAADGVGLGLAICRSIAQAHGGSVEAGNAPGGGAVFRVRLPLPGSAPPEPPDLESVRPEAGSA